jgi:hypothetical protein
MKKWNGWRFFGALVAAWGGGRLWATSAAWEALAAIVCLIGGAFLVGFNE